MLAAGIDDAAERMLASLPTSGEGPLVEQLQSQHKQYVDWIRDQKVYIDYPFQVAFETLALCNATCNFCPYPTLTDRIGTRMSDSLIEKIVKDLTDIPPGVPFEVNPGGITERFLDARMFDILALINHDLPNATLPLNSNGSTLNARNLERLIQVKNIVSLNVSLNEFRAEKYHQVMGLPFERTIANLDALHALRVANLAYFPVVVSRVCDRTEDDGMFPQWVRDHYPAFSTALLVRGDFRGSVKTTFALDPAPDIPCSQWFKLRFWADGKAAFCCVDVQPKPGLGDVAAQHVLEIYNSPERRRVRLEVGSRLQVADGCRQCNMLV